MIIYQKLAVLLVLVVLLVTGFYLISKPIFYVAKYENNWQKLIDRQGSELAYQTFKKQNLANMHGDQHIQAHLMGEALYQGVGEQGVAYCDRAFAFGCYHGFFSKAISENGLQIVEKLDGACEQLSSDNPGPCKHGIGHGLVEYFGTNRLAEALAGCDLTTRSDTVAGCPSGVFMEYNFPIVIEGDKAWSEVRRYDVEDPYSPCEQVPNAYQASCYHELAQFWGIVLEKDFQQMSNLCLQIKDDEMVDYCLMGVGHMVGLYSDYDVKKAQQNCTELSSEKAREACFIYGSWGFEFSDTDFEKALGFCDGFIDDTTRCVQESDIMRRKSLL